MRVIAVTAKENDLTNTPIFQRIPISLTLTAAQTAAAPTKRRTPRRRIALRRGTFMLWNGENLDFMRLSGIEKVHRNSIKITVDLWQITLTLIEFQVGVHFQRKGGAVFFRNAPPPQKIYPPE